MSLLLGPILQFRGIQQGNYSVSALVVTPNDSAPSVNAPAPLRAKPPLAIADVPLLAPQYRVWRVLLAVPQSAVDAHYRFTIDGVEASFTVPAAGRSPRLAYASCNGFSDPKYMEKVDVNNERWNDMDSAHRANPYHLLLMGGDQVYSDELRSTVPSLKAWFQKSFAERAKAAFSKDMRLALDRFFTRLYLERWAQPQVARMFASIPTIMMWDDHDIIDGWGSYPETLHSSPVFQGLFACARHYFRIFQQQLIQTHPDLTPSQDAHPCAIANTHGYHLGFTGLGSLALLVPDLRSERAPDLSRPAAQASQIVSAASWNGIYAWLDGVAAHKHLLVISSIPVGYLDLQAAEKALDLIPGQQELEDDLRDHWRSPPHRGERKRLIMRLLDFAAARRCKVSIVSGDVHVAGACVIESQLAQHRAGGAGLIYQLISSGIVHPSPPGIAVYFLESLGGSPEPIDYKISGSMLPIADRGRYLITRRNWLAIEPDNDARQRLWVNWHLEGSAHPLTQVIDPVG